MSKREDIESAASEEARTVNQRLRNPRIDVRANVRRSGSFDVTT